MTLAKGREGVLWWLWLSSMAINIFGSQPWRLMVGRTGVTNLFQSLPQSIGGCLAITWVAESDCSMWTLMLWARSIVYHSSVNQQIMAVAEIGEAPASSD